MQLQQEMLFEVVSEVQDLLAMHYEELTLNKDKVRLKPMWEKYAALENAGAFVVYTARKNGALVGYGAFFINQHLHYADLTVAANDVLFLHPEHRTGRNGIRLIQFCENELRKKIGSFKLTWHAKLGTDLGSVLNRMGYSTEESMLAKIF
jgi:hypothetical protein